MGLFAKAAPATVPPVPSGPEPDTLEWWQAELKKEEAALTDKTATKQNRENARHRRNYAADMVATFGKPGWNNHIKFFSPTPQHYHSLLRRAIAVGLEQEWLDAELFRHQVNVIKSDAGDLIKIDGWTRENYEFLSGVLQDLEEKVRKEEAGKKREAKRIAKTQPVDDPENYGGPIAEPGFSAKAVGNGTYVHGTNIQENSDEATEDDYNKVKDWALEHFNFDSSYVYGQWTVIHNKEKGEYYTKTKLCMLQERLKQIVRTRKKSAPQPETKGEEKVGLFKNTTPPPAETAAKVSEVAAEPKPTAAEEQAKLNIMQEARLRLFGMDYANGPLEIKDRAHAEDILRQRHMAFLELQFVHDRYQEVRQNLEQRVADLDMCWTQPLERFYDKNKPSDGKKTWSLLYGDLKRRDQAASVSLDPADLGERELQKFLAKLVEEKNALAETFEVKEQITFSRNMQKVSSWFMAEWNKLGKPPVVPGLTPKSGEKDRFSIGPAFDTAWDKIKKHTYNAEAK